MNSRKSGGAVKRAAAKAAPLGRERHAARSVRRGIMPLSFPDSLSEFYRYKIHLVEGLSESLRAAVVASGRCGNRRLLSRVERAKAAQKHPEKAAWTGSPAIFPSRPRLLRTATWLLHGHSLCLPGRSASGSSDPSSNPSCGCSVARQGGAAMPTNRGTSQTEIWRVVAADQRREANRA
jgi:hypothetical protein